MHWKEFWIGWIIGSLAWQFFAIAYKGDMQLKKSQWAFNVGIIGFLIS